MFYKALLAAACFVTLLSTPISAAPPRVLPEGKLPDDARLGPLKDLNGYFPFTPPKTVKEWTRRRDDLRRQILVANGLWPMPQRTPPQAVIHGRVERDDYTVDRVYLQSYPGHYVTGNLYRPKGKPGKLPGVLCPHGHWDNGRFYDAGAAGVKKQIDQGAEKFEVGGRYPLQARCVQLARMGCVVFHYDMLGYADSVQIPLAVAHKFRERRPHMEGDKEWGFYSPQAELHLQSIMGLQTYNSIRALDWLCELPDVDASRIGVTGASGGGTQTFLLAAIDQRVTAAFAAVMVSTAMQGGCTCENCNYLRVGTGNVELAALIAPRPLGMTAANDWTKEMPTKGFPELQQLYKLLGKPENVMLAPLLKFEHNYNAPSRDAMYGWFNKHLKLDVTEPIFERDYVPLSVDEATVWNDQHPKPSGDQIGEAHEKKLLSAMAAASRKQIDAPKLDPEEIVYPDSLREARRRINQVGWGVLLRRPEPTRGKVKFEVVNATEHAGYSQQLGMLNVAEHKESLPTIILQPKKSAAKSEWREQYVLWITDRGKAGMYGDDDKPLPAIQRLLAAGAGVVGVDLIGQGEFISAENDFEIASQVRGHRNFSGFTHGYNPSMFAKRVHDITSAMSYIDPVSEADSTVVGLDGAAGWVAAANYLRGGPFSTVAVDARRFRFENVNGIDDPNFLPGAAKYGGLPNLMGMNTCKKWVAGEPAPLIALSDEYESRPDWLKIVDGKVDAPEAIVNWLLSDPEKFLLPPKDK